MQTHRRGCLVRIVEDEEAVSLGCVGRSMLKHVGQASARHSEISHIVYYESEYQGKDLKVQTRTHPSPTVYTRLISYATPQTRKKQTQTTTLCILQDRSKYFWKTNPIDIDHQDIWKKRHPNVTSQTQISIRNIWADMGTRCKTKVEESLCRGRRMHMKCRRPFCYMPRNQGHR